MTYLMEMTDARPDRAIAAAVAATMELAKQEFKTEIFEGDYPVSGIGLTNLRARDISATNASTGLKGGVAGSAQWGVTAVTISTWTDWINLTTDSRVYILVTSFWSKATFPTVSHIRFGANGIDLPIIAVDNMYTWPRAEAYLHKPLVVKPKNNLKVRVLTTATIAGTPAEEIGLGGYVMGERNYLIAES